MLKNSDITRHMQGSEKSHLRKLLREKRALRWNLERVNKQIKAQKARLQSIGLPRIAGIREESTEIKSLAEVGEKFEKVIGFVETVFRENNPVESSE